MTPQKCQQGHIGTYRKSGSDQQRAGISLEKILKNKLGTFIQKSRVITLYINRKKDNRGDYESQNKVQRSENYNMRFDNKRIKLLGGIGW